MVNLLYHAFFPNTCGISKVGYLVSKGNIFLGSEKILNSKLTKNQYFLSMGVVSAIPNEWRSTIKEKSVHVVPLKEFLRPHRLNKKMLP